MGKRCARCPALATVRSRQLDLCKTCFVVAVERNIRKQLLTIRDDTVLDGDDHHPSLLVGCSGGLAASVLLHVLRGFVDTGKEKYRRAKPGAALRSFQPIHLVHIDLASLLGVQVRFGCVYVVNVNRMLQQQMYTLCFKVLMRILRVLLSSWKKHGRAA